MPSLRGAAFIWDRLRPALERASRGRYGEDFESVPKREGAEQRPEYAASRTPLRAQVDEAVALAEPGKRCVALRPPLLGPEPLGERADRASQRVVEIRVRPYDAPEGVRERGGGSVRPSAEGEGRPLRSPESAPGSPARGLLRAPSGSRGCALWRFSPLALAPSVAPRLSFRRGRNRSASRGRKTPPRRTRSAIPALRPEEPEKREKAGENECVYEFVMVSPHLFLV